MLSAPTVQDRRSDACRSSPLELVNGVFGLGPDLVDVLLGQVDLPVQHGRELELSERSVVDLLLF
jgi:hypothetical protein